MLNQLLRLERSIFSLDVETTGVQSEVDRIIQIALTQHHPTKDPIAWSSLINPGIPILNSSFHGITDADVVNAPTFAAVAQLLGSRLLNVDIMGFFVEFDLNFFRAEMKRAGVVWDWNGYAIDSCLIYRKKKPHSLENGYKEYVDKDGFKDAHNAANDVIATDAVLEGLLNCYQDLPRTVKELSEFCYPQASGGVDRAGRIVWQGNEAALNFGKNKGMLLRNAPSAYLTWMMSGDFSQDVKLIVQAALEGEFPTKP